MNSNSEHPRRFPTIWLIVFVAAAAFVEVASLVQAIRQDSWSPITTTGWLPVVVAAALRRPSRYCSPLGRSHS